MVIDFSVVADLFIVRFLAHTPFSFPKFVDSMMVGAHSHYRGWKCPKKCFPASLVVRKWLLSHSWPMKRLRYFWKRFSAWFKRKEKRRQGDKSALPTFDCSCARTYCVDRGGHLGIMNCWARDLTALMLRIAEEGIKESWVLDYFVYHWVITSESSTVDFLSCDWLEWAFLVGKSMCVSLCSSALVCS